MKEFGLADWAIVNAYYRHADGLPTQEVDNIRPALRPLRRLQGATCAAALDALALEALRHH
jgi:hypothetical protein